MTKRLTVVIADDHALMADALAVALSSWCTVLMVVTTIEVIEPAVSAHHPNVLLLDLAFGKTSSLSLIPGLTDRHPETRVVVLTATSDAAIVDAAHRAGAMAFVIKESASTELRTAIEAASAGRHYVTPKRADSSGGVTAKPHEIELTDRQRSILALLRRGSTNDEAAAALQITVKTVEYHLKMLKKRTGINRKTLLLRWAEQFFEAEL